MAPAMDAFRRWLVLAAIPLCFALPPVLLHASEPSAPPPALPILDIPNVPVVDNPFSREVFSLKELREDTGPLLERVIATRMDFPIMVDPFSGFARSLFRNPNRARFGRNFSISVSMYPSSWREDSLVILDSIKRELVAQGIDRGRNDREIRMELLVFLKNHQTLHRYAEGFPGVGSEGRSEVTQTLKEAFDACKRVLEFKALTLNGIKTLDEIDTVAENVSNETEKLEFERFVAESKDMRPNDIARVLEVRNPVQFRELCLERTREMLADAERGSVEEVLRNIEPSDAIVLASYFARSRIQEYRKPVDQMTMLYDGQSEELQVGDCRTFAGLAVHYLNLLVKPENPKLRHWYFGIERENVSDYHHAYVKAVHVYRKGGKEKIDLFLFDPVKLSSHSLRKLDKKDIARLIDAASANDHFFYIKRYGEDFVARRNTDDKAASDASQHGSENGEISFDALLSGR